MLVGGGGAAGLNAAAVAKRLGCKTAIIPSVGAALSAAGALMSDLSAEFAEIKFTNGKNFDQEVINQVLTQLEEQCRRFIGNTAIDHHSTNIEFFVEARYPQQIWEIDVPVSKASFDSKTDVKNLMKAFHSVHESIFEISDHESDVEFVTWRAKVSCKMGTETIDKLKEDNKGFDKVSKREIFFEELGWTDVNVFPFNSISNSQVVEGPAIVDSSFTTVIIDPGTKAHRDNTGSLIITI